MRARTRSRHDPSAHLRPRIGTPNRAINPVLFCILLVSATLPWIAAARPRRRVQLEGSHHRNVKSGEETWCLACRCRSERVLAQDASHLDETPKFFSARTGPVLTLS